MLTRNSPKPAIFFIEVWASDRTIKSCLKVIQTKLISLPICKLRTFCSLRMVSESVSVNAKEQRSLLRTFCMHVCLLEILVSLRILTNPNIFKTNHLRKYVNLCKCHTMQLLCRQLTNQYSIIKNTTIMTVLEMTMAVQLSKDTVWLLNLFKECVRSLLICDD